MKRVVLLVLIVTGGWQQASAQGNEADHQFRIEVNQRTDDGSIPATLEVLQSGITWQNKDMSRPLSVTWREVSQVKTSSDDCTSGAPGSQHQNEAYCFINIEVKQKGMLIFRSCCTISARDPFIAGLRKYLPKTVKWVNK
jgi:hypothetical protein